MRWLVDRNSRWWQFYEATSPWAAAFFVAIFLGEFTGFIDLVLSETAYSIKFNAWIEEFKPFLLHPLLVIIGLDYFKFKITGDPRDQVSRKYWSVKNAQRYLPNEVVMMPGNHLVEVSTAVNLQIAAMPIVTCPKCSVIHAFNSDETDSRTCIFYGCGEPISNSKTDK